MPRTPRSRGCRSPCAHTASTTARSTRSPGPRRSARRRPSSGGPASSRTGSRGRRRAARSGRSARRSSGGGRCASAGSAGGVSGSQFLLARQGLLVPVDGYFAPATAKALRRYQRSPRLAVDGVAGPHTLRALARGRPELSIGNARVRPAPTGVRGLLQHWATVCRVDPGLVRALAWMESGNQPGLVSPAGARGVMQVLPSTKAYVETVLLREHVPWTVSGGIRVGVVYLRQVLHEFHGNESLALAGWYQGPASVRRDGVHAGTKVFVADVLALRRRGV